MRVPTYDKPTVTPDALPNVPESVNYTSDAFGGQVGRATGQLGGAIGDLTARWQAEDDEAAVKAADTAFNDELRVLMHDPQKGFYAQRGSNAMNAYGGLDEKIQALRKKHGEGLSNQKQQQMFGQVTESRRSSTLDQAIGYTQRERNVWLNTTGEARMQSAIDDAVTDPSNLGHSLATVGREVGDRADREGWAPEKTQRVFHTVSSSMYAGQVERLLDTDPLRAAQLFAEASGRRYLTAEDTQRLQKGVKAAADKYGGITFAQDLFEGREPRNMAGEFRKYGVVVPGSVQKNGDTVSITLTPDEKRDMAALMIHEAGGEGPDGLLAVGENILTRLASGKWGPTLHGVMEAKSQYEPIASKGGGKARNLPMTAEQEKMAYAAIDRLTTGERVTGGATHFQNPDTVAQREAGGEVSAGLTHFGGMPKTAKIGRHQFYKEFDTPSFSVSEHSTISAPASSDSTPLANEDRSSLDYQLRRIMESDLSAEAKAVATSQVKTLHTAQKAAEKEASDKLYNDAYEQIVSGGISLAQLSTTAREKLTPSQKETLQKVEDRRLKGSTTSDTSVWYSAHQRSIRDPEAFAKLNLLEEYGADLSQADLKHFAEAQKKIIAGDEKESAKSANRSRAMNLADIRLKEIGIDPNAKAGTSDAKKVAAFQRQLFNAMNTAEEAKGRQLNEDETFAIIKSLTREVVTQPGYLWDSKDRDFMVKDKAQPATAAKEPDIDTEFTEIPEKDRQQIVEILRGDNKPATKEQILFLYKGFQEKTQREAREQELDRQNIEAMRRAGI